MKKKIWIVTAGEPLPIDGFGDRLHRSGMIAKILSSRGHSVTWWTNSFDHIRKRHRFNDDRVIRCDENLRINLLHSPGYKKNVSFARFYDHWRLSQRFHQKLAGEETPDVILAAMPTPGLAEEACNYGRRNRVPVVVDMRDMWPDIFLEALPTPIHPFAKPFFIPMRAQLESIASSATAIVGITPEFVQWGLGSAKRKPNEWDRHFWLGSSETRPSKESIEKSREKWIKLGVSPEKFVCAFFSVLSGKLDMDPVFEAAKNLQCDQARVQFVICGNGDREREFREAAGGLQNVIFNGWINDAEMCSLMELASVGLAPYKNRFDFQASIPTKAIQYLSAGLPILSGITGSLSTLLESTGAGYTYRDGADLARIIQELISNPESRTKMAQAARTIYLDQFVGENVYGKFASFLEELATQSSNC